ncbi:MAG TPA: hypothetical protein VKQ07_09990, partial [Jatrophihabitantaceae bacterium]|nr:hypothetical protein [Jatrophihabitantaceae bacterium]
LAGVKVYSDDKDGRDTGELVGRAAVGVRATKDVDAILAIDADVVLYLPRNTSLGEVCALLRSGKNVITTAFLFHPHRLPAAQREQLLAACREGSSTVHGTGLNPGLLSGAVPLALSGLTRRIERITLQERADWSFYESTGITFDNMRFGQPLDEVSEDKSEFLRFNSGIFIEEVWLLGDALDAGLDEVTTEVEVIAAEHDHDIFGVHLAAGTAAGQRWRWTGRREGAPLVQIETLWTVGGEYPAHWPAPLPGWTLTIEGDPSVRSHVITLASFERQVTIAEHVRAASVATAMQAVNAIPAVCAAPPGIATMADLPLIRGGTGFGNG